MQSGDRPTGQFFEDLSKLAGGALGAAGGLKDDLEAMIKVQAAKLVDELELVRREDFEAARDMAAKARAEQEDLAERLAAAEARIAALEAEVAGGQKAE